MAPDTPRGPLVFLRREFTWLLLGLVLGFAALPYAVYEIGSRMLGPYEGSGVWTLATSLYADFVRLKPAAWIFLLGPLAAVYAVRLCIRGLRSG